MAGLWLYVLLSVVVESEPVNPVLFTVALESCSEALVHGRCEARHEREAGEPYIARIAWYDPLHAHVLVRRDGVSVGGREVWFLPADPPEERYRALGLIVASYALADARAREAASAARAERSEYAAPKSEAAAEARLAVKPRPQRYSLDLAARGGPALDRGRWRAGGMLRAGVRPLAKRPELALVLSARGSHRPAEPRLTWAGLGAGLAWRLELAPRLGAEGRVEGLADALLARASDPVSKRRDRGMRYRLGGELGLELVLRAASHLSTFLGGALARMRPRVRVRVAGQTVGEERPVEGTLVVGLRTHW